MIFATAVTRINGPGDQAALTLCAASAAAGCAVAAVVCAALVLVAVGRPSSAAARLGTVLAWTRLLTTATAVAVTVPAGHTSAFAVQIHLLAAADAALGVGLARSARTLRARAVWQPRAECHR
ncbi:hypothetical protein OWR29_26140 [Actinoplanes sp. Pm04-4]|uniref:Uncharacterized protein n=1 Tax=Paractinoplanes pyxinae TaxID=2997416 RepID=A0ABT4B629_9ACTN|nr:hypothetical protein [Actinoplanes pyxinae]MCY1141492.1 hypothetical protein [Actinoplanes pyxinae]